MSKYLEFKLVHRTEKTEVYHVVTTYEKDDQYWLGTIKWFGRWRRYAFFPSNGTVFEPVCMNAIAAFMNELMAKRKEEKACRLH